MSIISLPFLVFFPLVLILYYIFPRRLQNWLLLIASYIFCTTWAWEFGAILLGSTLLNFYLARLIETLKSRDRRSITARQWSKLVFLGGIGLNVLVLAHFKYSDFFQLDFQMLLAQLGLSSRAGTLGLLLPVGLSFYTLGAISYLVDVDQENIPASQDLIDFGLYMAYFPKLLAGPIERARDFLPKLAQDRVVDNEILARSVTLIAVGLVQKVVIADGLMAFIPADMFRFPRLYATIELVIFWLAYLVVLYNDLAGYTRLARGVSGLFGIELRPNFAWPFFARNFTDLWPRWHSTLSDWLRDYIFSPLTRSLIAKSPIRREPWLATYRPVAWVFGGLERHLTGLRRFRRHLATEAPLGGSGLLFRPRFGRHRWLEPPKLREQLLESERRRTRGRRQFSADKIWDYFYLPVHWLMLGFDLLGRLLRFGLLVLAVIVELLFNGLSWILEIPIRLIWFGLAWLIVLLGFLLFWLIRAFEPIHHVVRFSLERLLAAGCWLLEKSLLLLEPFHNQVQFILPRRGDYFFVVIAPPVITMLVSGAWHRFTAHMLAWGVLNGLLLAGERLFFFGRQPLPSQRPLWRRGLGQLVFWVLAATAAVPFGMDLDVSLVFWQQLVTGFRLPLAQFNWLLLLPPIPLIGLSLGLDWVQYRRRDEFVFLRWPRLVQAVLLASAMLAIILVTSSWPVRPFIYQGF